MPLPLYSQGKSSRYPLYRGLCGPQSQSEHYREEKNVLPLPEIKPWLLNFVYGGNNDIRFAVVNNMSIQEPGVMHVYGWQGEKEMKNITYMTKEIKPVSDSNGTYKWLHVNLNYEKNVLIFRETKKMK
jgi:hypothetical protein